MDQREFLPPGPLRLNTGFGYPIDLIIDEPVDRGSLCLVYKARRQNGHGMETQVLVKECFPLHAQTVRSDQGFLESIKGENLKKEQERFRRAIRLQNQLYNEPSSRNQISPILDWGQANQTDYVLCLPLQGRTCLQMAPLPLERALDIAAKTAALLKKIHELGYLYLDLKPENVYVLEDLDDQIQLFDFDSVVVKEEEAYPATWSVGFSPPEQRFCQQTVDETADVFALGALLFYLLFGRAPTASDTVFLREIDYSALEGEYSQRFIQQLDSFFSQTLVNDAQFRFPSMNPVLTGLKRLKEMARQDALVVYSNVPEAPEDVLVLKKPLQTLEKWLKSSRQVFFLNGPEGSGKTTLALQLASYMDLELDCILYLHESWACEQLLDEHCVQIQNGQRMINESWRQYEKRRIHLLQEYGRFHKGLILLDHCFDMNPECLDDLKKTGFKILCLVHAPESRAKNQLRMEQAGWMDHEEIRQLWKDTGWASPCSGWMIHFVRTNKEALIRHDLHSFMAALNTLILDDPSQSSQALLLAAAYSMPSLFENRQVLQGVFEERLEPLLYRLMDQSLIYGSLNHPQVPSFNKKIQSRLDELAHTLTDRLMAFLIPQLQMHRQRKYDPVKSPGFIRGTCLDLNALLQAGKVCLYQSDNQTLGLLLVELLPRDEDEMILFISDEVIRQKGLTPQQEFTCLYRRVEIFNERGLYEQSRQTLNRLSRLARKRKSLRCAYHYLLSDYYDSRQAEVYEPSAPIYEELELALKYADSYSGPNPKAMKTDILLGMANLAIRDPSLGVPHEQILWFLNEAGVLIEQGPVPALSESALHMAWAFFYTYREFQPDQAMAALRMAKSLILSESLLTQVDSYYVPAACVLLDLKEPQEAIDLLLAALNLLSESSHESARLKQHEILNHLKDVARSINDDALMEQTKVWQNLLF